ncbi:MAG: transglycosylase SLT domain-containing protein [Desulfopila sp.]|jgi:soluble lytic murein transglycosylase-like protein|nr:transglycosylase SLT domain-containing protein [Desulfopila sp.]
MLKILPHNVFFVVLVIVFALHGNSQAELAAYVKKYNNITISKNQLAKLAAYNDLITYFSNFSYFRQGYKVSPDFIKALILAESGCNRYAVSSKNAIGLGQILFSTGKEAAQEIYKSGRRFRYINTSRLNNLRHEDLFDPAINILLTCYLISKYNYKFNGKLDLVVSAWNAGENTDSLKIGLPPPYSETRNLIGKINGYFVFLLNRRQSS